MTKPEPFFFALKKPADLLQLGDALKTLTYNSAKPGVDNRERPLFRLYNSAGLKIGIVVAMTPGLVHQLESLVMENINASL